MRSFLVLTCTAAIVTLLGQVACSGSSGPSSNVDPTVPADGSAGSPENGSSNGSSSNPAGDPGGDGSSSPKVTKFGTVVLLSNTYSAGTTPIAFGSASATFYEVPPVPAATTSTCSSSTQGGCEIVSCPLASPPVDAGTPNITYTNAGTITFSGLEVDGGSMTLSPGGGYSYTGTNGSVAFFTGGENVRVRAPGNPSSGGAPAFDVSQVAPTAITVTSPVFDAQGKVAASAGQDLNVTWTGASAADAVVQVFGASTTNSTSVRCAFPGGAGHGTVPSAALSAVRAAGGSTSFMVSSTARSLTSIDGWQITVDLTTYGLKPGGLASGPMTLE